MCGNIVTWVHIVINIVAEFLSKNDNQKREKVNESRIKKHTGQERTMGIL